MMRPARRKGRKMFNAESSKPFKTGDTIRFPWYNDIGYLVICEGEVIGQTTTCYVVKFSLDNELIQMHLDFNTPNLHRPLRA
jgi:hypothetical protein